MASSTMMTTTDVSSSGGDGAAGSAAANESFKMDRCCPLALNLKAAVSEKLTHYLDNFSDDILAEYIVVLVCNGKNQRQAKDELDAFLGQKSAEFVTWLWEFLSKAVRRSNVSADSSNPKGPIVTGGVLDGDADTVKGISIPENSIIDNEDNLLSKGEMSHLSTSVPNSAPSRNKKVHDPCLHWKPEPSSCLDVEDSKNLLSRIRKSEVHRKSGSTEVKHSATVKDDSTRLKGYSGILAGGEQHLQYAGQRKKQLDIIEKIVISNSNELNHQLQQSPNRKLHSRKVPSVMAENPQPRPVPVTNLEGSTRLSVEFASQQTMRPRGNVWDRLGAPCKENEVVRSRKPEVAVADRRTVAHNVDRLDQPRLMVDGAGGIYTRRSRREVPVLNNSSSIVIPDMNNDEYEHGLSTTWSPRDGNNSNRKRQFGEIDNGPPSLVHRNCKQFHVKETSEEFKRLSSPECNRLQRLDNVAAETRKLDATSKSCASRSPNIAVNGMDTVVLQPQLTRTATEDVLNVKLRLQQMELEVLKLRSKQIEVSNDSKVSSFSSSGPPGALSLSEADNGSRTVFVTNVHFAASKGALTMHFSKCGVITNVLMLNDATGKPKGSAYITFASEKSMDKALLLNGCPFWSRTLKVVRKADMPAVILEPAQLAGKPSPTWFPQLTANVNPLKPYGSSHLQWRRDQQANVGNSSVSATSGDGVDGSEAAKQNGVDSVDPQIPPTETEAAAVLGATETPGAV